MAQGDGLLNTREDLPGQFNKIIVGPLDAEFYGLDGEGMGCNVFAFIYIYNSYVTAS